MEISEGFSAIKIAESIISILEYIFEKLGIAINWTADTIIPYIKEAITKYANWKIDKNIFGICTGAALIIIGIVGIVIISYIVNKHDLYSDTYLWDILWGAAILAGIIIVPVCACNIIKAYNFPELSFAEWVSDLIRYS